MKHLFYKNNSNPLEEIEISNLKINELFICSKGIRYKYYGDNVFVIDKSSELIEGQLVENLDAGKAPNSLGIYWTLMKNRV